MIGLERFNSYFFLLMVISDVMLIYRGHMPILTTSNNELISDLPSIWHQAPRRWGHPLHAICSYMAMFPPSIPRVFIDWLTKPGDVVYDPFSGRGTTLLEACSSGRIGLGSDANPLAWILSSAKASPPLLSAIIARLNELRHKIEQRDIDDEAVELKAVFHPDVLSQLLWLRENLSLRSSVDRYIYSILLGILHANARLDGTPRGLTIAMPNTFAMAPRYVMRFKLSHNLQPPHVDVIDAITKRINNLSFSYKGLVRGKAWLHDITKPIIIPSRFTKPKLIFTSPPYLGVIKYAKLNWLRMWLIKQTPSRIDAKLFSSASLSKYLEFMKKVLHELNAILSMDGRICLVIGDVKKGDIDINLAKSVAEQCVSTAGLCVDAIVNDLLPVRQKVSRIWRERRGQATKIDRIMILSRPGTPSLPPVPKFDWSHSLK